MSFFSNVIALGAMPLLIFIYVQTALGVRIRIPYVQIVLSIILILLPSVVGILTRRFNKEWKICGKFIWELMELSASVLGILFFVVAFILYMYLYWVNISKAVAGLWVSALLMEPIGAFFGYSSAYVLRLSTKDCRTIAIETGVQSFALTLAMVAISFDGDEREEVIIFPLLYGIFYIINSAWIVCVLKWVIPLPAEVKEEKPIDADADSAARTVTFTTDEGVVELIGSVEAGGDMELGTQGYKPIEISEENVDVSLREEGA